jgi:hypothetical protein
MQQYEMAKPAKVEAKLRMVEAVAGSAGDELDKCFPPTPRKMTNDKRTGNHARRSYLTRCGV